MEAFVKEIIKSSNALYVKNLDLLQKTLGNAKEHLKASSCEKDYSEISQHYAEVCDQLLSNLEAARNDDKKKKQLKKDLMVFRYLVEQHHKISTETEDDIIYQVNRCKSLKELEGIIAGREILGFKLPGLDERYLNASLIKDSLNQKILSEYSQKRYEDVLQKKKTYLARKQFADRLAVGLTVVLSIFGIGLISGVAMMVLFPVMPLVAFVPTLAVATLLGGYTEAFVYHSYIKRFCRNCVRGFFKKIDDHILNREAKKINNDKHADRYQIEGYRQQVLKQHRLERGLKYALAVSSMPLSFGAGIGFTALAFTEILEIIPTLALTGVAASVAPWVVGLAVGPIYAMVMYSMVHKAIKNNIFSDIAKHVKDMFAIKNRDGKEAKFAELSQNEKLNYVVKAAAKVLGVAFVLGVSALATIFTAGAFLDSSVTFCVAALGVVERVAKMASLAVAACYLGVNAWFSVENSLKTTNSLMHATWEGVKTYFSKMIHSPKRILKFVLNVLPFGIHVGGMGAVATRGTEAFVLQNVLGPDPFVNKAVAATVEIAEETLVDLEESVFNQIQHKNSHSHGSHAHHDHVHGDLYSLGKMAAKGVHGLFAKPAQVEVIDSILLVPYKESVGDLSL